MLVEMSGGKSNDEEVSGTSHRDVSQSSILSAYFSRDGIDNRVEELSGAKNQYGVDTLAFDLMDRLLPYRRKERLSGEEGKLHLTDIEPCLADLLNKIRHILDAKLGYQLSKALAKSRNPFAPP